MNNFNKDGFNGPWGKPGFGGPDRRPGCGPRFSGPRPGFGPGFDRSNRPGGPGFGPGFDRGNRPGGPGFGPGFDRNNRPGGPGRGPGEGHFPPTPEERKARYEALSLEEKLTVNLNMAARFSNRRGPSPKRGQNRVLSLLSMQPDGVSQRMLQEVLDIRAASLSELLGKLEAAGLVERFPNEADKRSVMVALTEEGRNAAAQAAESPGADDFPGLAPEEIEALNGLLEKLNAGRRERFAQAAGRGPALDAGEAGDDEAPDAVETPEK